MNRLKQLREEKELKQEDIAKLLHLEIAAISKFETGRVPLKDEYIKILCNFFDVSSDYLLGLSDVRCIVYEAYKKRLELEHNDEIYGNTLMIGLSREDENVLTDEDKDKIREFAQFIADKRRNDSKW